MFFSRLILNKKEEKEKKKVLLLLMLVVFAVVVVVHHAALSFKAGVSDAESDKAAADERASSRLTEA